MKITIEATSMEELQEALQHLTGKEITREAVLQDIAPAEVPFPAARVQPAPVAQPVQAAPVPAAPEPEPEAPQAEPIVYSMTDVRGVLSNLTKAGKKAQVQELIRSFGVDKLSQIPEDRYPEVMQKAGEL
ncbi:hypothetical protein [Cuneatibacter caecimuris]|uniref:Uncharacterized protein n=1 Tax=Cuneatibacter caecimuris TaxID=1796618 RepID=A0A4Q7PS33_9FIRM|nr:hypothetical protein [Cuneatibacter caecimuris]RZT02928.1 hypothetical protein EV209_1058 [Cuneatibacter caecimuris]